MCSPKVAEHANIIQYKHAWVEEFAAGPFTPTVPCLFILMEWASGGSLQDCPEYAVQNWRLLFTELCAAVGHLHRQGLVHGDLKPSNVMLRNSGGECHVILSDLGQCREPSSPSVVESTTIGTIEYMSPELARRELDPSLKIHYEKASDIWSLGMILYWMLNKGVLPFASQDNAEILNELASLSQSRVDALFAGSSPERKALRAMLRVDPAKRPTINDIIDMLSISEKKANRAFLSIAVAIFALALLLFGIKKATA